MDLQNRLREYLTGLQLRHFTAEELMYLGSSHQDNGLNHLPPAALWQNIVRPAQVADLARSSLQSPLRVISAFRGEKYNEAVSGASGSYHTLFNAIDLAPVRIPARQLFDLLYSWREEEVFAGGLGLYRDFVHLDTRGVNSTWGANN